MRLIYNFKHGSFKDIDVRIVMGSKVNDFNLKNDCEKTNIISFISIINEFEKSQLTYITLNRQSLVSLLQLCAIYDIEVNNDNFKNLARYRAYPNFIVNDVFNNWDYNADISLQSFKDKFHIEKEKEIDIIEELFFRIKKAF